MPEIRPEENRTSAMAINIQTGNRSTYRAQRSALFMDRRLTNQLPLCQLIDAIAFVPSARSAGPPGRGYISQSHMGVMVCQSLLLLGLEIDEPPVIANGFDEPLAEGMVIALEPKRGVAGVGMVGTED